VQLLIDMPGMGTSVQKAVPERALWALPPQYSGCLNQPAAQQGTPLDVRAQQLVVEPESKCETGAAREWTSLSACFALVVEEGD
jgi:disulfide bond formation protein DsbB